MMRFGSSINYNLTLIISNLKSNFRMLYFPTYVIGEKDSFPILKRLRLPTYSLIVELKNHCLKFESLYILYRLLKVMVLISLLAS